MATIFPSPELEVYYRGPGFGKEPLPAFFYFALSGEESLELDPYNQPVLFLNEIANLHIFSITLPGHGKEAGEPLGHKNREVMEQWSKELEKGHNFVAVFVAKAVKLINQLIERGIIDQDCIAVAGLSRGAFFAAHLAAADQRIKLLLGYAPLTQLEKLEEFEPLRNDPLVRSLAVRELADRLADKQIRFYIGNLDHRVGTEECFQTVHQIAELAYKRGIRSPKIELIISPSIGQRGHGTSKTVFQDGISWLKPLLRSSSKF